MRRAGWGPERPGLMVVLVVWVGACSSQMLPDDPAPPPGMSSMPAATTSMDALETLVGPHTRVIIGTTASAAVDTPDGAVHFFAGDPGTMAATAAAAGIPVCSVELATLQTPSAMPSDLVVLSVGDAQQACAADQLTESLDRLRQLRTPSTVVIVAANTAATTGSTNNGINYFYGDDVLRMLHAARQLNVSACVVTPMDLALPTYPSGQTPGLAIDEALASCGR